jgi:hypothetical protein
MFVSIGVATGEGVAGASLAIGGEDSLAGLDDGLKVSAGDGVGPPSRPE